jgi:hypothetical protein
MVKSKRLLRGRLPKATDRGKNATVAQMFRRLS